MPPPGYGWRFPGLSVRLLQVLGGRLLRLVDFQLAAGLSAGILFGLCVDVLLLVGHIRLIW